ncbi:MAG: LarC family nickel insertion protein [Candidatus Omnitrophica bacterium]|nr:LarC family nickel insertion protein [Candidatus Omnitrophota bacterium]
MKILVFNCPRGVTGEGIIKAILDAGLSSKRKFKPRIREKIDRALKLLKTVPLSKSETKTATDQVTKIVSSIENFGIQKCFVRNLAIGRRGRPETLKLLLGFTVERIPVNQEIVTPAGAVILATLCEKETSIPSMTLERVGHGGNEIRVSIGETAAPYRKERILLLETNIDDMSPQGFELLYQRLFKAGALDVWVQSILMKKMRPAFKLSVLLNHKDQERIAEVVFKETPSLGVRFLEIDRFALPRKSIRIMTRFGPIRMKIGFLNSKHTVASPEYEDLKKISEKKDLPFQQVYRECLSDWAKKRVTLKH